MDDKRDQLMPRGDEPDDGCRTDLEIYYRDAKQRIADLERELAEAKRDRQRIESEFAMELADREQRYKNALAAVAAERERCCKALCVYCQRGDLLQATRAAGWRHPKAGMPCNAAAIRALPTEGE